MFPGFVRPHFVSRVDGEGDDGCGGICNELAHHCCVKSAYLRFFFSDRFLRPTDRFLRPTDRFLRPDVRFLRLPAPICDSWNRGTAPCPCTTLRFVLGLMPNTGRIISAVGAVENSALKAGPDGLAQSGLKYCWDCP